MPDLAVPEVSWWHSTEGPAVGHTPWAEGEDLPLAPGSALWVVVAATNRADYLYAHSNLVVAADVEVLRFDQRTRHYDPPLVGASNPIAGRPPGNEVKFFSAERRWPAGMTWMGIYLLVVPPSADVTLVYDVTSAEESSVRHIIPA